MKVCTQLSYSLHGRHASIEIVPGFSLFADGRKLFDYALSECDVFRVLRLVLGIQIRIVELIVIRNLQKLEN